MKLVRLSQKLSEAGRGLDTCHTANDPQHSRWSAVAKDVAINAYEFRDLAKETRDYLDEYSKEPPEVTTFNGIPINATRH